jgi:hypothetical protein
VFARVSGKSVLICLHEVGLNEPRCPRDRICRRESIGPWLHKTPQGVCSIETGSVKVDAIKLACGCCLNGLFGYLSCGPLLKKAFKHKRVTAASRGHDAARRTFAMRVLPSNAVWRNQLLFASIMMVSACFVRATFRAFTSSCAPPMHFVPNDRARDVTR